MPRKTKKQRTAHRPNDQIILAYCDGSCPKPHGPGGYGGVILTPEGTVTVSGWGAVETNNTMELMAAISTFEALLKIFGVGPKNVDAKNCNVLVLSDSQYVVTGLHQYRTKWEGENWIGVKNLELWHRLYSLHDQFDCLNMAWIKGHNGNYWNEVVDKLAGTAREEGERKFAERAAAGAIK